MFITTHTLPTQQTPTLPWDTHFNPRVWQVLAKDKHHPGICMFSMGSGANNNSKCDYYILIFITFACIMTGEFVCLSIITFYYLYGKQKKLGKDF